MLYYSATVVSKGALLNQTGKVLGSVLESQLERDIFFLFVVYLFV